MTDCVQNVCVTGFNNKKELCFPGSKPGLQYYTARSRTQMKACKSRCDRFDNSPDDWCYVSDNEWDYCNPEMGTEIVRKAFTSADGPCRDSCDRRGSNRGEWCHTYWGTNIFHSESWNWCKQEIYTYMRTKTLQGLDCLGICGDNEDRHYNWCLSSEWKKTSCAPTARNFSLINDMFDRASALEDKGSCRMEDDQKDERNVFTKDSGSSGFVSSYADSLEYPNMGFLIENVNETRNAIYRYTVMPSALLGDPIIPLVVRAKVTNKTIIRHGPDVTKTIPLQVRYNLEHLGVNVDSTYYDNEHNGHIISYMLGGPGTDYNFVALTQRPTSVTTSVWLDTEDLIHDFVVETNGWAEITVVVIYSDILESWQPDGYAIDFSLYNSDGTLYRECNDYYYSNHVDKYWNSKN